MVVVTPAEPGHAEALAALLEEMGQFYGAAGTEPLEPPEPLGPPEPPKPPEPPEPPEPLEQLEQRVRQVRQVLFGDVRGISALLAWDDTQLAGLAAYSFLWPAIGLTRSLYLKELYVGQAHRGKGVGKLLMDSLREVAARHGCSRLEWTTDDDNAAAQRFYAGLGVPVRTSKLFYRVELGQRDSG